MRVKPVDPNAVIRDPVTKMRLPAEGGDVPDNIFWQRRLRDKSVVRVEGDQPTGDEPIKPLTTR